MRTLTPLSVALSTPTSFSSLATVHASQAAGIDLLAIGGLVLSWLAAISMAETGSGDGFIDPETNRSALYYAAHAGSIACVMLASIMALSRGQWKVFRRGTRLAFVALFSAAILWSLIAYTPQELLSTKLIGATGPFVWITLLFVAVGTDRHVIQASEPVIRLLAYATAALAVRTLITHGAMEYSIGLTKHTYYTTILMWLGGWTLLCSAQMHGSKLLLRAIPYAVMLPLAIQGQGRSWILMWFLTGGAFLYVRKRVHGEAKAARTVLKWAAIASGIAMAAYLTVLQALPAVQSLKDRAGDDTRSNQYVHFFADVHVYELILGRGPNGSWYWPVVNGDYQFFDNGFLWMLFIGGLPTLLGYIAIVIWPTIELIRAKLTGADAAAVFMICFWALALTGLSTFTLPSVAFTNFLISLLAGRCHSLRQNPIVFREQH